MVILVLTWLVEADTTISGHFLLVDMVGAMTGHGQSSQPANFWKIDKMALLNSCMQLKFSGGQMTLFEVAKNSLMKLIHKWSILSILRIWVVLKTSVASMTSVDMITSLASVTSTASLASKNKKNSMHFTYWVISWHEKPYRPQWPQQPQQPQWPQGSLQPHFNKKKLLDLFFPSTLASKQLILLW